MFYPSPLKLGPVVTMETGLMQTVKDFTRKNGIDIKRFEKQSDGRIRTYNIPMTFTVRPDKQGTPGGYAANIHVGSRGIIHLPAGGLLWITHDTGRIDSIASTMPLRTLSFDEVMALAKQIDENITALGFKAAYSNRMMKEEAFEEIRPFGHELYARWDVESVIFINIRIKPYSSYSRAAFTTPIGLLPDKKKPETYLLEFSMGVKGKINDEIWKLGDARAIAITGDKNGKFPAKIWFDDPDWRPEGWQGEWIK